MRGDRTIGARMRSARLRAGWSQEMLGVLAGIEEGTVSARMSGYENGKHTPAPLILERIADALKIPAPYFYAKDDGLADLIFCYGQLSAEGQARVIQAARRLVKTENTKNPVEASQKSRVQVKRAARKSSR